MLYNIYDYIISSNINRLDLYDDKLKIAEIEYCPCEQNYYSKNRSVYITYLKVIDSYRNKGIGKKIMNIVIARYPTHEFALNVQPFGENCLSFKDTCNFYKSLGFKMKDEFNMVRPCRT